MTTGRILHVLAQRPGLTGSGVTLDALVRHAAAGWDQAAVIGVPADAPAPQVGDLPPSRIRPLGFGTARLPLAVPGMSDVMPYPSTRYSEMTPEQLDAYRTAWREHLTAVIGEFEPDLIHSHHLWIVTSMLHELAPTTPIMAHCHATGLRQMELCPDLAPEVRAGCSGVDRFITLHRDDSARVTHTLDVPPSRVHEVGAGFCEDLFNPRNREEGSEDRLLFAGKLTASKGLPWLLNAFERLAARRPGLELHVAGGGAGAESEELRRRMREMGSAVVLHGQLDQPRLAELMRRCSLMVLPSLYEGLPLVLVEARACGCQLVATALPGVVESLAPHLGKALHMIRPPTLRRVDDPEPSDLPRFVDDLDRAIERTMDDACSEDSAESPASGLEPFTWRAVFERVEAIWTQLLNS